MQTEIEVKFLAVDHDAIRARLQAAGAKLIAPMRLHRRTVFVVLPTPEVPDAYLRVRDEGDSITVTYKRFDGDHAKGAQEIETTVGDYETMIHLLETLGHKIKSRQESKRETWQLQNCEVVLDEWPWLKPYLEIEGLSEAQLKQIARLLELEWRRAVFGSVTRAYQAEYNFTDDNALATTPLIAFGQSPPAWLAKVKRTEG